MYVAKHIVCKMSPLQYLGHQILFKSLQANVHSFHMNGLHRRVGNNKRLRDCNDEYMAMVTRTMSAFATSHKRVNVISPVEVLFSLAKLELYDQI